VEDLEEEPLKVVWEMMEHDARRYDDLLHFLLAHVSDKHPLPPP